MPSSKPLPSRVPVLIVGAGPTGLTAAALLTDQGVETLVVDRSEGVTPYTKALGVQARTLELFERIGLADAMVEAGAPIQRAKAVRDGRPVAELPVAEAGKGLSPYPYVLSLPQSDTERLLLEGLRKRGGEVHWDSMLTSLTMGERGAMATVRDPQGDHAVEADWVVGADGASSLVRKATGQAFVGGTYEQAFFLADLRVDGAEAHAVTLDMLRDGLIAYFPLPGDRRFRVIASIPEGVAPESLSDPAIVDLLADRTSLPLRLGQAEWTSVFRLHHRRAEHFRVGRALLAGDAAHVHSPVGGQGMNTGIGDAFNLAWKLGRVVKDGADPALLQTYAQEREPFAKALLAGTDRAFTWISGKSRGSRFFRRYALPGAAHLFFQLPMMQRALFRLVSQTTIAYPDSPLSVPAEPARPPRSRFSMRGAPSPLPGDRAPDAVYPEGGQLFSRLAAYRHHLLLLPGSACPDRDDVDRSLGALAANVEVLAPARGAELARVYGAPLGGVRLVRPDGYLAVVAEGAASLSALDVYAEQVVGPTQVRTVPRRAPIQA